jgi:hypothetical protein
MNITKQLVLVGIVSLLALPAMAATISLVPSSATVSAGDSFTVTLVLDAADARGNQPGEFRGKILVDFGSSAAYNSFTYDAPAVSFGAETVNAEDVALGFDLANGVGVIGSFSFTATGNAGDIISLNIEDAVPFIGSFFNTDPTVTAFTPDFIGASVTVIPVPAAAWLMIGALGALLGRFARRKS